MRGGKPTARNSNKLQEAVAPGALGVISWNRHVRLCSPHLTTGDADGTSRGRGEARGLSATFSSWCPRKIKKTRENGGFARPVTPVFSLVSFLAAGRTWLSSGDMQDFDVGPVRPCLETEALQADSVQRLRCGPGSPGSGGCTVSFGVCGHFEKPGGSARLQPHNHAETPRRTHLAPFIRAEPCTVSFGDRPLSPGITCLRSSLL